MDLEIFGLITLSNGSAVRLCGLPILFLPADDIASRMVCQHQLSFVLVVTKPLFVCLWTQDIIDNPDIHLDEMFIASLVFDLIKVS